MSRKIERAFGSLRGPCFWMIYSRELGEEGVPVAAFHEDVDVVAGFGEVDEVDNVEVFDLLADDDFRLDSFDDV